MLGGRGHCLDFRLDRHAPLLVTTTWPRRAAQLVINLRNPRCRAPCGSRPAVHRRGVPLGGFAERGDEQRAVQPDHSPGRQDRVQVARHVPVWSSKLAESLDRQPDAGREAGVALSDLGRAALGGPRSPDRAVARPPSVRRLGWWPATSSRSGRGCPARARQAHPSHGRPGKPPDIGQGGD